MSIEPKFLEYLQTDPDLTAETGAECEIVLPDYCPDILRILQSTALTSVETATVTGDRITVEGTAEHRVLYLAEDGVSLYSVRQQSRYRYAFERKTEGNPFCAVSVRAGSTTARALSPKKILARTTVSIRVRLTANCQLTLPETEPDTERLTCRGTTVTQIAAARKPLHLSDEFEADETPVKAVLQSCVTCRPTEEKPLEDKLIVKADMHVDLLCCDENGLPFALHRVFPVSQILDLPGTDETDQFLIRWQTVSADFSVRDGGDPEDVIAYDLQIDVCADAFRRGSTEWTADAYSVKDQTECTKKAISARDLFPVCEEFPLNETVDTGAVSEVVWAELTPDLRNLRWDETTGKMVCEGIWEAKMILKDAEGSPVSTLREIPFTLTANAPEQLTPVRNDTVLTLTGLTATVSDGTHVNLRGDLLWSGGIFTEQTCEAVTGITRTGARPRPEDTFTLYYAAKDESVWQIAREHACGYEELKKLNHLEDNTVPEDSVLMILRG